MTRSLNAFAKSFGSDQPATTAQSDLGRYFLLLVFFSQCKDHSSSCISRWLDNTDSVDLWSSCDLCGVCITGMD